MTRIFVSYARVDIYLVRQLVAILEAGGHEAWFDHRLLAGQDWKEQLRSGIATCDAFVYALTPESIASEWCRWEFARAIEMGKPIIPVLFQANTQLPDLLSCTQYVDFSLGPTPEAAARLMSGLSNLAVRIPAHNAPKDLAWPRGFPSRVPDDIVSTYGADTYHKKPRKTTERQITPAPAHIKPPANVTPPDVTREQQKTQVQKPKKTRGKKAATPKTQKGRAPFGRGSRGRKFAGLIAGGLIVILCGAAIYWMVNGTNAAAKNTPSSKNTPRAVLYAPSATPLMIGTTVNDCQGAQPSRLKPGTRAWIPREMGGLFRLVVRSAPGLNSPSASRLYAGNTFTVIGGPTCSDWMTWWQIQNDQDGITGWAAESDRDGYYMQPLE